MGWAFLFLNVGVVLLACRLRYAAAGLEFASPAAIAPRAWWWAIACACALTVAAAIAGRKALRRPESRRAVLELLAIFPPFFAFEWGMLPPERWRVLDWSIMTALVVAMAAFCWRDRRNSPQWGLTGRNFVGALGELAIPTAVFAAVPVAAMMLLVADFQTHRASIAMFTYPFYALAQLLVFQLYLVQRLRRVSRSVPEIVLVSAGVFSLVHWPNGLVMSACFVGGSVWTVVYLGRPNLYALALSMGLSAAVFASALPRDLTQNLRTGPIYVQRLLPASSAAGIQGMQGMKRE